MNTNCDKSRSVKLPTQKRIDSIDLFKGIAILGIVWKHTFHPQWCDLIHISALFFILSGIFFKDEPFIPFLKKKIRTILIPFLFFYILSYLARMAFYFGHFRTLHGFAWDSLVGNLFYFQYTRLPHSEHTSVVSRLPVRHANYLLVSEQSNTP